MILRKCRGSLAKCPGRMGTRGSDLLDHDPAAQIRSNLPLRPRPLDLDPTDLICSHRFGLDLFLKRPPVSSYSTRGPQPFKNNYRLGLFYSLKPLIFPNFEPAVQVCRFCELDPGINVYLCLGPRFLQKTPLELNFSRRKALNLVFSLENAF